MEKMFCGKPNFLNNLMHLRVKDNQLKTVFLKEGLQLQEQIKISAGFAILCIV